MSHLALAIGIADTLVEAGDSGTGLDIKAAASELIDLYPEANASLSDVVETLTAAG